MTLLRGGSPFPKHSPLYMQSLVPRVIGMIEFGTEGDNSTVARYKITKMNPNPNPNSVQMI